MKYIEILSDERPAPHNGTPTSRAAALSIMPRAGTLRAKVLATIIATNGATNEQISDRTGMLLQTVCARVNELARGGFIEDSGRTNRGRSGRDAVVWVKKEKWHD
jgi:hypothetical protein